MDRFYRRPEVREAYQEYIDKREAESFDHPFERQVAKYLLHLHPAAALEIGCGNGRFFRTLRRAGFTGKYLGTEVAGWIVEDCRRRHPDASWIATSAYDIPLAGGSFDVCFSYGVVESFVHPEKALAEMLRVLKPGGRLVLLFPDFVESGRLGSQLTGLSPGRARTKLERGRWLDAAITVYDPWTGFLLTGDTVYPGRLYVSDFPQFLASLDRMTALAGQRAVTHVLGCHIEMTRRPGRDYPIGSTYQPAEPPLEMTAAQLGEIRAAAASVASKRGIHRFDDFIIYNEPRVRDQLGLMGRGLLHKAYWAVKPRSR